MLLHADPPYNKLAKSYGILPTYVETELLPPVPAGVEFRAISKGPDVVDKHLQ
jgi:hypothetical protein